jgi:general secretion pathway protein M
VTAVGNPLSRGPAFALLALILVLPVALIAWGFLAAGATEMENATAARQLDALRARVAAIRSSLGDATVTPETGSEAYLPPGTPALAGATMQQRLADTIANTGGRLLESQVLPSDTSGSEPGRVDFQVSFETRIAGLQQALFDVETGVPVLFVRNLSLRALEGEGSDLDTDPTLRVELTVSGYQPAAAP